MKLRAIIKTSIQEYIKEFQFFLVGSSVILVSLIHEKSSSN